MLTKFIKQIRNNNGYTLVELLVVMAILGVLTTMGADYIVNGFRSTTFNSEQEEATGNARNAITVLTKEIRGANMSDNGSYILNTITDHTFVLYSDINNDNSFEKIRYYLSDSGTQLMKDVIIAGSDNQYHQATTTTLIASYLNNQTEPIFTYFDGTGATTTVINDVRMIGISLKINVTPWRAPNDYYVVTKVTLRNIKSNL